MQALELTSDMRTGRTWRGLGDHQIRTPSFYGRGHGIPEGGSMTDPKTWRKLQGWMKSTSPDLQPSL